MVDKERLILDRSDELYTDNDVAITFAKQWIADNPDHWYEIKRNFGFSHISDDVALDHVVRQNLIFKNESFNAAFITYCDSVAEYEYERLNGVK